MTQNPLIPTALVERERARHYIPASEEELESMLADLGLSKLEDLYSHLPKEVLFEESELKLPEEMTYDQVRQTLENIARENIIPETFIQDGLSTFSVPEIVDEVLSLRELTTSYTPYQPERSQGSLSTLWIYQSAISALTGFEAINASYYERSTAAYEAILCARRLHKKGSKALVAPAIYPGDRSVLDTLKVDTGLNIDYLPYEVYENGRIQSAKLKAFVESEDSAFCLLYPQVNSLGLLEDVHSINDLAQEAGLKTIAMVEPMLLGTGGLCPPSDFGQRGADMFVAEGQSLALKANFGGPGLGVFGIRHNENNKNSIRATSGRLVGKANDIHGREGHVIVLSTREQHIRREKANSNICSNQAYLATLAGAALLQRGEMGLANAASHSLNSARLFAEAIAGLSGVELAFPEAAFFNQVLLRSSKDLKPFFDFCQERALVPGVDVSERLSALGMTGQYLLVGFSDDHQGGLPENLLEAFKAYFQAAEGQTPALVKMEENLLRKGSLNFPSYSFEELKKYYRKLADQNVSPDEACYPLGSCTMKYNPYLNDYTAGLEGFQSLHPQVPEDLAQGNLKIIYETQEWFKTITGLPAVTTQPVAGAQGELVGLKLFQAYFRDRGEKRDVVLIPRTAHGTNPATAVMAGFEPTFSEEKGGIITLNKGDDGEMDLDELKTILRNYGARVAGMMVTNPNTAGIFEKNFHHAAKSIHEVGGLVYMDGANMNAIAGWVHLGKLGVDAVHNNTHKTWSIPHGGGGPGDAFVAVSEKLVDFLPGIQVAYDGESYSCYKADKSIGDFHRHYGNFAHKVRAYTYLLALGRAGVRRMSAVAVLSARYLYKRLTEAYPVLPARRDNPRMHEFIITLSEDQFAAIEAVGLNKASIIGAVGKLFLDFGFHAPTVSFPEPLGLMIEPTESYTKAELDRFADCVLAMHELISQKPEVLKTAPHFTPVDKIDEVSANRKPVLYEKLSTLPDILENRVHPSVLAKMSVDELKEKILQAHAVAMRI